MDLAAERAVEAHSMAPNIKIACLQLAPQLGKVQENIARANELIKNAPELRPASDGSRHPLWLVLPEMAFSGYNYQTPEDIEPFLEPTTAGPSTRWAMSTAQMYNIYVTVGYPEIVIQAQEQTEPTDGSSRPRYNSTVTVSPSGAIIGTCRKRFLYYTDEPWADEGLNPSIAVGKPQGFFSKDFGPPLGKVSQGICMDINPYKFITPFNTYEFATHVLDSKTPLTVLSMAWLTHLLPSQLEDEPEQPDSETLIYWTERFHPLKEAADSHGKEMIVVCANRAGQEGSACYAGTSCVMRFKPGVLEVFDICGRAEEKVMVVDLGGKPKFAVQRGG